MSRAVLFDVDGVLVHSFFHPDPARRRRWDEHLLEDMGVEPGAFAKFFEVEFDRVVTGQEPLVSVLDVYLPTIGYRGTTLDFVGYWLSRDTNLNRGLIDVIRRLGHNADVHLYIATNQEHLRANYLWNELKLGHIFEDIFYAARLGVTKPGPAFHREIDARIGPQSAPPLFFDDSPKVVEAAIAYGWDAVVFNDVSDVIEHPWVAAHLL